MANPLLSDGRAYDSQGANPVGTEQWQRGLPMDMKWENRPEPFNLYKWIKDTQPQYTAGNLLKALGAGALAGPEMMGRAMRGKYDPDSSVDREAMEDFAGVAGGSAFGGRPAPILRSLGGPMSKLANLKALDYARMMESRAELPRTILQKTSWWQNPQKEWKFEIPDDQRLLRVEEYAPGVRTNKLLATRDMRKVNAESLSGQRLSDVLEDAELFKHYPALRDVKVGNDMAGGGIGNWDYKKHQINLAPGWRPTNEMAKVLGHEVTHATQSLEKWQNGSAPVTHLPKNYTEMYNQRNKAIDAFDALASQKGINDVDTRIFLSLSKAVAEGVLSPKDPRFMQFSQFMLDHPELKEPLLAAGRHVAEVQQASSSAHQAYKSVTGEVDARAVGKRLDWSSSARRHRPFWEDYDVSPRYQMPAPVLPWMGGKP